MDTSSPRGLKDTGVKPELKMSPGLGQGSAWELMLTVIGVFIGMMAAPQVNLVMKLSWVLESFLKLRGGMLGIFYFPTRIALSSTTVSIHSALRASAPSMARLGAEALKSVHGIR